MYLDKEKILSAITEDDIIKICEYFGYPDNKRVGDGLGFNTALCHKGDSPHKLVIYPPNEEHKHFTCHCFTCSDTYDLIELVIRASRNQGKTMTWYKALYTLAQITGYLYEAEVEDVTEKIDLNWLNSIYNIFKKKKKPIPTLKPYNENVLDTFYYGKDVLQGWINEGMSISALNRFEIGYNIPTNQITIPHRDWKNNNLIGVRGRYIRDEDVDSYGKYVPMYIEGEFLKHPLGNTLYGLWITKEAIKRTGKIMLVESEKAVIQAYTIFGEDSFVVSVCGSNITQTQIKIMLKELQVSEVMVAFDREYEDAKSFKAEAYYNKLIKKVAPLVPYCRVYLILDSKNRVEYKQSPLDYGEKVIKELMKEKC